MDTNMTKRRQDLINAIAIIAINDEMPLDAAAVELSSLLEEKGVLTPDDTMENLMESLQSAGRILVEKME